MVRLYKLELEKECPYGKDPEKDFQVLLNRCHNYHDNLDIDLIEKAYYFCIEQFKGVVRKSGDPYYTHLLKVALNMFDELNYADNETIAAALLHDAIEDKQEITKEIIEKEFNKEIADIVDGVTKIKGEYTQKLDKAATYAKLFESLIKDVRVILIKLADRLDNLRTLEHQSEEKQKIIANETLQFYTPFAQRLGLIKIKRKLEDLSLFFADREKYDCIQKSLEKKQKEFLTKINRLESQISQALNEKDIKHILAIEHKHIFQIYRMINEGRKIEDIDNFYSIVIRLMSNDYSECYKAYGVIANLIGPVKSFEDYISKPKINFYKALHSTHITEERNLVEIIIRTEDMDSLIETGMIGLLSIKSAASNFKFAQEEMTEWINWMHDLVQNSEEDALEKIWGSILKNLDSEYISVYTLDRTLYQLPEKSSLLDLAFAISDDLGLHFISAKVNGMLKSMTYELQDNDVVEIIPSPNTIPKKEWENYVITFRAVVKLYYFFKNNQNDNQVPDKTPAINAVKFKIMGTNRTGLLNEISSAIGQINILRVYLYQTTENLFEGMFNINISNDEMINELFVRLLDVEGLQSIEIFEGEDSQS